MQGKEAPQFHNLTIQILDNLSEATGFVSELIALLFPLVLIYLFIFVVVKKNHLKKNNKTSSEELPSKGCLHNANAVYSEAFRSIFNEQKRIACTSLRVAYIFIM